VSELEEGARVRFVVYQVYATLMWRTKERAVCAGGRRTRRVMWWEKRADIIMDHGMDLGWSVVCSYGCVRWPVDSIRNGIGFILCNIGDGCDS
jgi:hypothetical protein